MPLSALLLALAAAAVHAAWNLLLSGEEDTHSASAVAIVFGTLVFAPVAVLTWRVDSGAVPYILGSSALELVYLALLATAYSVAAMSFIYPIARGSAPVLVLVAGVVALGVRVSVAAAVGVVIVALGIVLVRGLNASGRAARSRSGAVRGRVHRRVHAGRQARDHARRAALVSGGGVRLDRGLLRPRRSGVREAVRRYAPP